MSKPKIGITIGDMNGIGLEVILKTFSNHMILDQCIPVVYGSTKVMSYHKNIVDLDFQFYSTRSSENLHAEKLNIINCWQESVNITLGRATDLGGKYAQQSLEEAVKDLKDKKIDALVTAPINKKAMQLGGFPFTGHTEYLADAFGVEESLMLLVSETMKMGLATNHLPIGEVAGSLNKEVILKKLDLFGKSLQMDFGLERPTIAVLGLNPHASDEGLIGNEEEEFIRPAIIEAKKSGIIVNGPFPADGFFGSGQYHKYDGIMAMYHDQGLIPFKALSFGTGVNFTAGLPIVRTSPDHGTAYNIVGQNMADPASFRKAVFLAIDITRNRQDYLEMRSNALVTSERSYNEEEDEALSEEG